MVIVKDPNDMNVGFIHDQVLRETQPGERIELRRPENPSFPLNTALEKHRKMETQRFHQGPCPVHKLGHYGYVVPKSRYDATVDWYMTVMNLKPTDAVYDPETGKDETCFMHIDSGTEATDHHVRLPVLA
jgi:hypothetical protein